MTIMSYAKFKKQTSKKFSLRNGAIGKIDSALKDYWSEADPETLRKLKEAVDAFVQEKNTKFSSKGGNFKSSAWERKGGVSALADQIAEEMKGAKPSITSQIAGARAKLKSAPVANGAAGQSYVVGSNNTAKAGWAYAPFDPDEFRFTAELNANLQGPLTKSQTARITESLRRTKTALRLAHSALVDISGLAGFPATPTRKQQTYIDYFGPYDRDRVLRVKRNYTVLKLAAERGPRIVDLRDTDYGKDVYAACFRGDLGTRTSEGQVSVLSAITVFLGRAFFAPGTLNYGASTDASVGTLIHEFAHGAVNAVDVPPVNGVGGWTHARVSDDPTDDEFGSSTDNSVQASTIPLDKLLARHKPDYAVVNADNYGQFAAALLVQGGG